MTEPGWAPPPQQPSGWGAAPQWGQQYGQQYGQQGGQSSIAQPPGPNGQPGPGQPWGPPPGHIVVKPGIVPLRPLRLGEIIDGAFQAIRSNPRTMLGMSAAVALVLAVVGLVPNLFYLQSLTAFSQLAENSAAGISARDLGPLLASAGGVFVVALLRSFATSALTVILALPVGEAVLGRKLGFSALRERLRGRLLGILGLTILTGLGPYLVFAAAIGLSALPIALDAGDVLPSWVSIPTVLVLVLAGLLGTVYLYIRWSLAGPAYALEGVSVIGALRRSGQLVRGSWWRLFGIQILVAVIVAVVAQLLGGPAGALGGIVNTVGQGNIVASVVAAVLVALGEVVVGAVVTPFAASVIALLYFDRRMRSEGFDVELTRAGGATPA